MLELFASAFATLFVVIDPPGCAPIYYGLTSDMPARDRRAQAIRATVIASAILLVFALFGLIGANFNALAMEPLSRVAGVGSASYGFATTTIAGVIGGAIGRAYDGTTVPLVGGFFLLGLATIVIVAITERGRLFTVDPVQGE